MGCEKHSRHSETQTQVKVKNILYKMKKILFLTGFALSTLLSAQESPKEVKTTVDAVTVFTNGAQITRKKTIMLPKGVTELKFTDLSPFIAPESVNVKAVQGVTILSVSHKINFLDKLKPTPEVETLTKEIERIEKLIESEQTYLEIVKDNLDLLQKNKELSGKNAPIQLANLQQVADYYNKRLTELKFEENTRIAKLEQLTEQLRKLQNQKQIVLGKTNTEKGEIYVKVSAESAKNYPFEVQYIVDNAHWTPSYDLRATDITQPINLIYKANVQQDTKEDWDNVKFTFSSADPNLSGGAPSLQTYFLSYGSSDPNLVRKPKAFGSNSRAINGLIQGVVVDEKGEPIPGVVVIVKGTTMGTSTDFDGKFTLNSPNDLQGKNLEISFIGYKTVTIPAQKVMTVRLQEETQQLEEVVVVGYGRHRKAYTGSNRKDKLEGKLAGAQEKKNEIPQADLIPVNSSDIQTNVQFEIATPYTVKSDNQTSTVDMQSFKVAADYKYYIVPKVEQTAYLIGYVTNWQQYNLLEGEANIFFEDTFVGKTNIQPLQTADTLKLSLGQDKKVSVTREKIKQFASRQFMGSKKEDTRLYKTIIRNNKQQSIYLMVLDQLPIPTLKEIEVNALKTSDGKYNKETGELKWEFALKPSEKKEIEVEFSVKYPKNRTIWLE